jgi:hypothetical protein
MLMLEAMMPDKQRCVLTLIKSKSCHTQNLEPFFACAHASPQQMDPTRLRFIFPHPQRKEKIAETNLNRNPSLNH